MIASKKTPGTRTNIITSGTDLASIHGINLDYLYSINPGFIFNKSLELTETPVAKPVIHSLPSSNLSYSFEFFHDNLVSIKAGNNLLAYVMVNPSHKPSLFSRNLLEKPSGRSCAFGLKLPSQMLEPEFFGFNLIGTKEFFIGSNSYVIDSNIDPNNGIRRINVSGINISDFSLFRHGNMQKQSIVIKNKISRSYPPIKIFNIIVRDINRDLDSPVYSYKGNVTLINIKAKAPRIISYGSKFFHNRLGSLKFRGFKNLYSLIPGRTNQLCWKFSFFSNLIVSKIMQFYLVIRIDIPAGINNFISRIRILFHSLKEYIAIRNLNLHGNDRIHYNIMYLDIYKHLYYLEDAIPLSLERLSFLAQK